MAEEKARRGGKAATGKRGTFTFRVTEDLRARLTGAASQKGRPVSEEIEDRLTRSFETEPLLEMIGIGGVAAEYIRNLAPLLRKVQSHGDRRGYSETMMREALRSAADTMALIYFWTRDAGDVREMCRGENSDLNQPADLGRYFAYQDLAFEFVEAFEELNITPLSPRWAAGPPEQGPPFNSDYDRKTQRPAGWKSLDEIMDR